MYLDPPAFFFAIFLLALLNGILFAIGWLQDRRATALAFWAAAHLMSALGAVCLALGTGLAMPGFIMGGLVAMSLHYAFNMRGVQLFERRIDSSIHAAWPVVIVVAAMLASAGDERTTTWGLVVAGASASVVTAYYFWRAESGALRWSAITILLLHATFQVTLGGDPKHGHSELWHILFVVDVICYGAGGALLCMLMSQHRAERELRRVASTDELTGLPNRRTFVASATAALQVPQSDRLTGSMLMFDLDGFKGINDRHGHLAGDYVLSRFAAVLRDAVRGDTPMGRLGGEEFAALLPLPASEALGIAEQIRAALADEIILYAGAPIAATVSIGISAGAAAGHELKTFLAAADRALYRAKANGRNRVELDVLSEAERDTGDMPARDRLLVSGVTAPRGASYAA
jgi:diguanylate cyclase (GGDEF)-like protein